MGQVPSSLKIALLVATALVFAAAPARAATDPGPAQPIAPAPVNTRNSAVYVPAAPAAETPKPTASEPKAPLATGAGKTAADPNAAAAPGTVEVTKLKHQIKATRLSLADTQGRLAVTEKDLANASGENAQLRTDTTNLRVGLAKAETVAQKSDEELGLRRQEVHTLQTARHSGWGMLVFVLSLSLLTVGMLAVVLLRHGSRLRAILDRLHDAKSADGRVEQLRAQLEEERERSRRLAEERLRAPAAAPVPAPVESQASAPIGSKREKLEHVRRELRQVQAAAESEKQQATARIRELEAELVRASIERQTADQRLREIEPELAALATAKQELSDQVGRLEPEVARLAADRADVEDRARELARDVARLTAEKLRVQLALSKANERLAFFGYDEPEDTLPPVVG
jgi:chromosome segregation ATPase